MPHFFDNQQNTSKSILTVATVDVDDGTDCISKSKQNETLQ